MRRGVATIAGVIVATGALGFWAWSMKGTRAAPNEGDIISRPVPADGHWGAARIMTANIRISSPNDGDNVWPNRRALVVKTFLKYQPEILACQEVSPAQGAYLDKELGRWYAYYPRAGVGSLDGAGTPGGGGGAAARTQAAGGGGAAGELLGVLNQTIASLNRIYYRSDRWDVVDGEAGLLFPNEPQPDPTENAFFTLAVLKEKGSGDTWIVVNAHLRHQDAFAIRCAVRVREKVGAWSKKVMDKGGAAPAVIVTGDINHDRVSQIYAALVGGTAAGGEGGMKSAKDGVAILRDAFDYAQKPADVAWGNWHKFDGKPNGAWPTDLVLFSGLTVAKGGESQIIRDQGEGGRYPSDHYFVIADLERPAK